MLAIFALCSVMSPFRSRADTALPTGFPRSVIFHVASPDFLPFDAQLFWSAPAGLYTDRDGSVYLYPSDSTNVSWNVVANYFADAGGPFTVGPSDSVFTGSFLPPGGSLSGYVISEDYGLLGRRPVVISWWFLSGFFFAFACDVVYGWLGLAIGGIFRTVPHVFD